jgi:N-methylhydantoinase B
VREPYAGRPNPITLEVVRNALFAIAEEMRVIVMRSARSPLIKEAGDLSCVLTDAEGRLIAEGRDHPIHLGVMAFTVKEFLKRIPADGLLPGDQYITNALDVGGNHLPDVKLIKPVFVSGELVAFAVCLTHWADIGGMIGGSYYTRATEIYQEGLQLPPIRLFDTNGTVRPVMDLILLNIREPGSGEGDILAQFAANEVAGRRLEELTGRYGIPTIRHCFGRIMEESEELIRAEIRRLPDGAYYGEDVMDDDGLGVGPIKIVVTVTIDGDQMIFDYTGTDPQARGPINVPYFGTCSGVYYAVKALIGPHVSVNDGAYRPITVIAPPGTLLNPHRPAPVVGGNHETTRRVHDAAFRALAPVLADRINAGSSGTACCTIWNGRFPGDTRRYILYETHGGGAGASMRRDGESGIAVTMGNQMNTPIEVLEAAFPVLHEAYGLVPDSGGTGRHRGGLAIRRRLRNLGENATLTTMFDRVHHPPFGLFGGEPGACCRIIRNPGTAHEQAIAGKTTVDLAPGDVVEIRTGGGGGFGHTEERDQSLVERDLRLGYVSSSGSGTPSTA